MSEYDSDMSDKKVHGEWAPKFDLGNVAIHLHLLPTGKVLYWGRRAQPVENRKFSSLNEHKTSVYLLDLESQKSTRTSKDPVNEDELPVNLFCAGHTFQPDGTLIIFGGHVLDGLGEDQVCVYDPFQDSWTVMPTMVAGRWYPTAITLTDGRALVVSGSSSDVEFPVINLVPQILDPATGIWSMVQTPDLDIFALYPRLYHAPDGQIFMAGPLKTSRFLDLTKNDGQGQWSPPDKSPERHEGQREYAASATYDAGKILYVGGGGGEEVFPTKGAEIIDLNDSDPQWTYTSPITKGRRHHFATTLPDGTVLVTGGTQGKGFNDLSDKMPVHEPELWDPVTGKWTMMVPESDDRCYHHTALLLPDARVLSAGSGEYAPNNGREPNDPKDTLITAQIFSPPYLFKGKRPTIVEAPSNIKFGEEFKVTVAKDDVIGKISWTRLGSVTHTHNMNQSFQFLKFTSSGTEITVKGPTNQSLTPPGHYMLFLVSKEGVPSKAPIILLKPDGVIPLLPPHVSPESTQKPNLTANVGVSVNMQDEKVKLAEDQPPVVVGLIPACPYGLGPCWGGAYEALSYIEDVKSVRPRPNQPDSTAYVYLKGDIVPDIDVWKEQLFKTDGGTYTLRGIEMTLSGKVLQKDRKLILVRSSEPYEVTLNQYKAESKLQWDHVARVPRPVEKEEAMAYTQLSQAVSRTPEGLTLQVTGRLQKTETEKGPKYSLDVKSFVTPFS